MTQKGFKLFLICLLSISALCLKNRLKVGQVEAEKNNNKTEANNTTLTNESVQPIQPVQPPEADKEKSPAALNEPVPKQETFKFKAIYNNNDTLLGESSNITSNKSGEASKQNDQKVQELIEKLKKIGLNDENIKILGTSFKPKAALQMNQNRSGLNATDETSNEDKQLIASSELEINFSDSALLENVINELNSQKFNIESFDYIADPKIFKLVSKNKLTKTRICVEVFGNIICWEIPS